MLITTVLQLYTAGPCCRPTALHAMQSSISSPVLVNSSRNKNIYSSATYSNSCVEIMWRQYNLKAPTRHKDSPQLLKTRPSWQVEENRNDGSMPHQKDSYLFGVVSYSSDPSVDRVGPLVGVPEAIWSHYDRFAGHSTPPRPSTKAKTGHDENWFRLFPSRRKLWSRLNMFSLSRGPSSPS